MYGLWVMGELWVFHTKSEIVWVIREYGLYGIWVILYINDRPDLESENGIGAYQQIN